MYHRLYHTIIIDAIFIILEQQYDDAISKTSNTQELLHNLNELYSLYEEFNNKEAINRNLYYLIDKGQRIITKRILSYL